MKFAHRWFVRIISSPGSCGRLGTCDYNWKSLIIDSLPRLCFSSTPQNLEKGGGIEKGGFAVFIFE